MGNEKLVTRSNKRHLSSLKQSHTQKFIVSCIHRVNKWLYFKTEKKFKEVDRSKANMPQMVKLTTTLCAAYAAHWLHTYRPSFQTS